jgi:tetratricopeptide (TPR) repeat protein
LEYFYTIVLRTCGRRDDAAELLKQISERPSSAWRDKARFDLIELAAEEGPGQEELGKLLMQLSAMIANNPKGQQETWRSKVVDFYCRLLLEQNSSSSAQKVLGTITQADVTGDPKLHILVSRAHQQLGDFEEAVKSMQAAIESKDSSNAPAAMELLSQTVEQMDQLRESADDFSGLMENSLGIARYCQSVSRGTYGLVPLSQASLVLAEFSIYSARENPEMLAEAEKLLGDAVKISQPRDPAVLRCRARLAAAKEEFKEAADLWAEAAAIHRAGSDSLEMRSFKWWRAKYYELQCRSKQKHPPNAHIVHTIDVLERSIKDIPDIWRRKMALLKQHCQREH